MTCRRGSQDTRGRILEVALRMFARRGYVTTSMEEIAREVGVTKPAIYHHFKGKDAIFLALIVYCLNYLGDGLRDVFDPKAR